MQGGYALNPALRLVLVGYVRVEKPRLYLQVNQEVVTLYRPLLRKDYREHYLVELLYHELAVLRLEKGFDLPAMQTSVSEELLRCIGAAASMRDTDLISLRNSLVHDPDLKGYVSKQALATIQDLINSRLKESRLLSSGAKRLRMGQDGLLSESFA
jgi:hypothetical protein